MSELCPCGSKLKIDDCCVYEDIAKLKSLSVDKIIMPERLEWAIYYIESKTIHNKEIVIEQNRYVESIGKEITCRKGCSKCCFEFIGARIEECDAIAVYLYFYPNLMNKFLVNYDLWRKQVASDDDNILKLTSDAYRKAFLTCLPEDKETFERLALEFAKKKAPCPFLEDDLCLIYPIRPHTCSAYAVISDEKYCDSNLPEDAYIKHQQKIKSAKNPLYFEREYIDIEYYIDLKESYIFGAMQSMLYRMLKYGPSRLEKVLQA